MQIVKTNVTSTQVQIAQGAPADTADFGDLVWVECPDDYEADMITAADIVGDGQITVVEAPAGAQ